MIYVYIYVFKFTLEFHDTVFLKIFLKLWDVS